MNLNDLAVAIADAEKKKSQVNIAQIKEIIGIIADISFLHPDVLYAITKLGIRRAEKKCSK